MGDTKYEWRVTVFVYHVYSACICYSAYSQCIRYLTLCVVFMYVYFVPMGNQLGEGSLRSLGRNVVSDGDWRGT